MSFQEDPIRFGDAKNPFGLPLGDGKIANFVRIAKPGQTTVAKVRAGIGMSAVAFGQCIAWDHLVLPTITSGGGYFRGDDRSKFHDMDFVHCGSFPEDYDFMDTSPQYVIGMSVPPIMTAQVASRVAEQIFGIK